MSIHPTRGAFVRVRLEAGNPHTQINRGWVTSGPVDQWLVCIGGERDRDSRLSIGSLSTIVQEGARTDGSQAPNHHACTKSFGFLSTYFGTTDTIAPQSMQVFIQESLCLQKRNAQQAARPPLSQKILINHVRPRRWRLRRGSAEGSSPIGGAINLLDGPSAR